MGTCSSANSKVFDTEFIRPKWTYAVQVRSEFQADKISTYSTGFRLINNSTIELHDNENKYDGARWSRGFISGQHVIEFIFPVHLRGHYARVGLGTSGTKLGGNNTNELLGAKQTWAVDLIQKRKYSDGKSVGAFPAFGDDKTVQIVGKFNPVLNVYLHADSFVILNAGLDVNTLLELPDWFFMYIDLDLGTLHFGSDTTYFGTAFDDVTIQEGPLYPIVTASEKGAIVGMVYRGEGKRIDGPLRKRRTLDIKRASERRRMDSRQ